MVWRNRTVLRELLDEAGITPDKELEVRAKVWLKDHNFDGQYRFAEMVAIYLEDQPDLLRRRGWLVPTD